MQLVMDKVHFYVLLLNLKPLCIYFLYFQVVKLENWAKILKWLQHFFAINVNLLWKYTNVYVCVLLICQDILNFQCTSTVESRYLEHQYLEFLVKSNFF